VVDFDAQVLEVWLKSHLRGFGRIDSIERFAAGHSNPSYRLVSGDSNLVLRRKPFGKILSTAHAVEREYRLLRALSSQGYPVPRPITLCEDREIVGVPFYIMEYVPGRTFSNGLLPELNPTQRTAVYYAFVDALARLHQVDPVAAGLSDFGRPGNYFARQVKRWTQQYRATQTDSIPEMDRLMGWLPQTLPTQSRTSIVHGDYRIDNLLFSHTDSAVAAVLDWELATLGDPLADFAYMAMRWIVPFDGRFALGGQDLVSLGIPSLDDIASRYCDQVGWQAIPTLHWYFAYNLFRSASIIQGIKWRASQGNASNERALEAIALLPIVTSAAWEQAELAQKKN
jgi:aminoglycoside phosphotransferase (APT) family kinase protein